MPYRKDMLHLHVDLPKAHSSLLRQIRAGKIGLAAFSHQRRVSGFGSPACDCGWPWKTVKHVIFACPRFTRGWQELRRTAITTDFQVLTANPHAAAALAAWFLGLNILPRFCWALDHL